MMGSDIINIGAAAPKMPLDKESFEKCCLFTIDSITSQDYITRKLYITEKLGAGPKANDSAKNCQW